jgi:hypothetical protein
MRVAHRVWTSAALLALLQGCGTCASEPEVAHPAEESAAPEEPPAATEALALPDLDDDEPPAGAAQEPFPSATPPERGCVEAAPRVVVWPSAGAAAAAAWGDSFLVAGHVAADKGGEELFIVRVAPGGTPVPLGRTGVAGAAGRRLAAPALLVAGGDAWVAHVDGDGALGVAKLSPDRPGAPLHFVSVAGRADHRFSPSLARAGDALLLAWVDGSGKPMRVRVARLDLRGRVLSTHDVTLAGMGGTAPIFVAGATPPVLVFVDARAGISPLVRVSFAADGTPGESKVVRSVGQVPEPPAVAAAQGPAGPMVSYTAIGTAATTAVGLMHLDTPERAPVALVPGEAYGTLGVAAAALPQAAVFVSETATPSRGLRVHRVDGEGLGEPLLLEPTGEMNEHPAAAAGRGGTVAITLSTGAAVEVIFLRCS